METELKNRKFILFIIQVSVIVIVVIALIIGINYFVDASQVITSKAYAQMAKIAVDGNIVAMPENYNERVFQMAIVEEMSEIPETLVIGSSRGMYLGEEITGYKNIYNCCVSGACMEDYYALLGLYYDKFAEIPSRVIVETSPWVFYENNPEARWTESYVYMTACKNFFQMVNGCELERRYSKENPYFSIPYFQYNFSVLMEKGLGAFKAEGARISTDCAEPADYADGTIRYSAELENASVERLGKVKSTKGAVTYAGVNNMMNMGENKVSEYENLLRFLLDNNTEVIIYMQPFSVTQCQYIYDEKNNLVFSDVEEYLTNLGREYNIPVIGGYDARKLYVTDELFIDFMHLDKTGTRITWNLN